MRSDCKMLTILVLTATVFCAKPKTRWLKWQEELDLAYANELSFKIDMQKKVFYENEPLVFKMLISNKLDIPRTIVPTSERTSMIAGGFQTFKVVTASDTVLMYFVHVHANIGMQPEHAIVLGPHDTVYVHAILCPDMFRRMEFPYGTVSLPPGDYILESVVSLGTKFYPRPARGLQVTSHPTLFSIELLPIGEIDYLSKIRPWMKTFFGNAEEGLWSHDDHYAGYVDSALFWLNQIRKTNSIFAPYADFVYTCIPAVNRTHSDTIKLNRAISEARRFIENHEGSILAEEMEFKLAWWLFLKDSTSVEYVEQAKKVIGKYPKNINSFGIMKLLAR